MSKLEMLRCRLNDVFVPKAVRQIIVRRSRRNRLPFASHGQTRRLFVDVSVIHAHDAGTGIQRVVRAIALALQREHLEGWELQFVGVTRKKGYHRISWPDGDIGTDRTPIEARPGDVFLGLDYSLDGVRWHRRQLSRFRRDGGLIWFLVHDLLPLQKPDWFSDNTVIRYRTWLNLLAGLADGFFCNSVQTESELRDALVELFGLTDGYVTRVLPMGHDLHEALWPNGRLGISGKPLRSAFHEPFVMMVGTLEPRKGHADILDAYDWLWSRGSGQRLVFVGRAGWHVEDLKHRIAQHPEIGRKLFWFDDVSDEELAQAYGACSGIIVGSLAEGYGLPVIEALAYGKPVLARDLPVFRMHQSSGVRFFPGDATAAMLADCIEKWNFAIFSGEIVITPPREGWLDAARLLLSTLAGAAQGTETR